MGMERCDDHDKLIKKIDAGYEAIHRIDKTTTELSTRINGSIHDIEHHIASGQAWRIAIVCSALGWIISLLIQLSAFSYMWGRLTQVVEINTNRITIMENLHPRGEK
jgi:hypothetical protein